LIIKLRENRFLRKKKEKACKRTKNKKSQAWSKKKEPGSRGACTAHRKEEHTSDTGCGIGNYQKGKASSLDIKEGYKAFREKKV